jgi:single-strand DNA-binding protein
MSEGMMKMEIIGNLGADPVIRMAGEQKIANFRVAATTRERKDDDSWGDKTEWMNVVCFGNNANRAEKILKKGTKVYISGTFKTDEYDGKDGTKKFSMEVIAKDLVLC